MSKIKYLSVSEYAKQQGVRTSAVYNRLERKTMTAIIRNGIKLVDVDSYTPKKVGRPRKAKK